MDVIAGHDQHIKPTFDLRFSKPLLDVFGNGYWDKMLKETEHYIAINTIFSVNYMFSVLLHRILQHL